MFAITMAILIIITQFTTLCNLNVTFVYGYEVAKPLLFSDLVLATPEFLISLY